MLEIKINVANLAKTIKKLKKDDLEILTLLISEEGKELLKRKKEIVGKKIKTLSQEEVFNV